MMTLSLALLWASSSYALIVTNNRSLELDRPDLQYADDDGAAYAELYAQMFGPDRVTLLTTFDRESARLHESWAARARPPTLLELDRAIEVLSATVTAARGEVDVHLVFAGHGDLDRGQGFLELEDGRLTARALEERAIGRIRARRIHLILDSCNSYFMINPRRPGGERWRTDAKPQSLLDRHPNVGVVLSTSAEAVTYEWSEIQSGVFSYEVRSGLRGAADADEDGLVTYSELSAFITRANAPLRNDLYRPKVFAYPPKSGREVLMSLRGVTRRLEIPATDARRLTIRDQRGVRVADVHNEKGTKVVLALPTTNEPLVLTERVAGPERPKEIVRELPDRQTLRLEDAPESSLVIAERGEAPLFQSLFSEPFGRESFRQLESQADAQPEHFGITRKDAEQLGLFLDTSAALERDSRRLAGTLSFAGAAVLGGFAAGAFANPGSSDLGWVLVGASAAFLGLGVSALVIPSESERLLDEYAKHDFSNEAARASAVSGTEAELAAIADDWKVTRQIIGGSLIGISGLSLTLPVLGFAGALPMADEAGYLMAGLGVGLLGLGIHMLTGYEYPVERTFELEQQSLGRRLDRDVDGREERPDRPWMLSFGGSF
ncbi:MAG: hypothetical protein HY791_35000 [Deltaproteobacteria bacterium]|nr:hypothetical protein [Deltaproteobacteria bacterium]